MNPTQPHRASGPVRRVALLLILGLLSAQMGFVGTAKILGFAPLLAQMAQLHFGPGFARFLGACEVLGVVGLWWPQPKVRSLALLCFLAVVLGAIGAHFGAGQGLAQAMPAIVSLVLLVSALALENGENFARVLVGRRRPAAV